MSICVYEAALIAIAEDVHTNTCLLAKIVVDADLVDQTILQWHQVYTVPTGCQLREVNGLSPVKISCCVATLWNVWSNYL